MNTSKTLQRNASGMIAGVCAALAAYFGISLVFIRLVFISLLFMSGIGAVLYIILLVVIPPATAPNSNIGMHDEKAKPKKNGFIVFLGAVTAFVTAVAQFGNHLIDIQKAYEEVIVPILSWIITYS